MKEKQPELTIHMRAILVDWLVEVQENFELNHETLYLAVKLVDHYLSRKKVARDRLQLIGATSVFIACKFDVRLNSLLAVCQLLSYLISCFLSRSVAHQSLKTSCTSVMMHTTVTSSSIWKLTSCTP